MSPTISRVIDSFAGSFTVIVPGDLGIAVNVLLVVNHVPFNDVVTRFVCCKTTVGNVSGKGKLPG